MEFAHYFASGYPTARAKFLEAAESAGASIASYTHPDAGPEDTPLAADVAVFGDAQAPAVLLVNTGTHGIEGFAGSAALVGWLRSGAYALVPSSVRTVLVHAINPHGFAWLRRTNEDNIDLNRNFVDHGDNYPDNPEYVGLHSMLAPERLDDESLANCDRALSLYAQTHGTKALQAAISRGQYTHQDGLFFGGHQPSWSNRSFCAILAEYVTGAQKVAFVDIHTGLGPYGHGELICDDALGSHALRRAQLWFGPSVQSTQGEAAASTMVDGDISNAVRDIVLEAQVTALTAEFGTQSMNEVFAALRADNWLHFHADPMSKEGRIIKANLLECFCPDDPFWRELVWIRCRQILTQAVAGLTMSGVEFGGQ